MTELRTYQATVVAECERRIVAGERGLIIVAPTGSGKTIIAAALIKDAVTKGLRVLVLAHTREIIKQTSLKLSAYDIENGIIQAGLVANIRETTDIAPPPKRSAARCKLSSAQGESQMEMRKFAGSSFYKVADVRKGPVQEKIAGIVMGKYGKPDAVFESGSKLSLNATNVKTLIRASGTDSEFWRDQTIELFEGEIEYQGKPQEAVLLRAVSTLELEKKKKEKKARKPDPLDDEVPFDEVSFDE
jgi:Type III restriction enzyme, res subunit